MIIYSKILLNYILPMELYIIKNKKIMYLSYILTFLIKSRIYILYRQYKNDL